MIYGEVEPEITFGSNHIRCVGNGQTLRLTTNASVTYVRSGTPFLLDGPLSFYLGPDESLAENPETLCRHFEEETVHHWKLWTRRLSLPLEYQEAVIRAAITLKFCTYEETGAIMTSRSMVMAWRAGLRRSSNAHFSCMTSRMRLSSDWGSVV